MTKIQLPALLLISAGTVLGAPPAPAGTPKTRINKLLDAIEKVESGGRPNAVGDQGRSRGAYQIQQGYWQDATKHGKVNWAYKPNVYDKAKSRQVVQMYWKRYAPEAYRRGDMETLARIHNGGPNGHKKQATQKYWAKVKKEIR